MPLPYPSCRPVLLLALVQGLSLPAAEQSAAPSPVPQVSSPAAPVEPLPAKSEPVANMAAQTVELPRMTVLAPLQRLPDEKDVMSKTDKASLLRKRYPGASLKGQDPERSKVPNYAAFMYREDERLRQLRSFNDLAAVIRLAGDDKAAAELEKEAKLSLMRRHDMRTEAMDRSANNDRR